MAGCDYDIGITERKDGAGYALVWDLWGQGQRISDYIGTDAEKLLTQYSHEFINQFANTNGFMLDESVDSEGNIVMNMMQ